jgi:membrane protein DedA with SNARE-associated domain
MRTTIYVTAGTTHRVSFPRFLLIDTMAALISVPVWVYLGYFGANNHEWLVMWIRRGQGSLWAAAGMLAALLILLWWRRSHRARVRGGG